MIELSSRPPAFLKRCASFWIDLVLLLGTYLILGFSFRHIFDADAYPKPTGMQLYSERDFAVYWFFVRNTLILSSVYLFVAYRFFGATLGQAMTGIRLYEKNGGTLATYHIMMRIVSVQLKWFFVFFPGPIVAFLFLAFTASFLGSAVSMVLLVAALLGLLFRSITRYNKGRTRSLSDRLSKTYLVDIAHETSE
ncbi:MAG: hypothetical protein EA353_04065 [Puniceicoccaceae bacterium]|nr:MAG: hypothetical protein EA353_04065 [Puniceicoccaceae bacterium]